MGNRSLGAGMLIAIAVSVFCVTLYRSFYGSPQAALLPLSSALAYSSSTMPIELKIPKLGIDAKVQRVGITKSGAMGIPSNFSDVAWYEYGPVPGGNGNAVIDGHVDNAVSLPGVFKHLDQLTAGDNIDVVNASGKTVSFTVTRTESLPYNATSTADIFSASKTPGLVLITCSGNWIQSSRQYSDRLIVFATIAR